MGGHEHCQAASSQNTAVTAFVDKFLRNKTSANTKIHVPPVNRKFNLDHAAAMDWTTPVIQMKPGTPKIAIKEPLLHSFEAPATIKIVAEATDSAGSVKSVEFFNGSERLIALDAPPL